MRFSAWARAKMASSFSPRSDSLTESKSCPLARRPSITLRVTFSLARIRMGDLSASGKQINLFRFQHFAGIRQARLQVLALEMVVFVQNLLKGPASAKQIDDKLYG